MNTSDAKEYLARREIPQLFESLLTGLMYYQPDDPIEYLEGCLKKARELGGPDKVRWDTFVGHEKKPLPPLNGGQTRRSLFRNVLPDSHNLSYRHYDRLPPISQFSIESDSDLSETAELIEEYEVFGTSRPRPKVILVIGGPGSGKGTQCMKIAERYGFHYVSVGELLRKKMIHNATSNRKWSLIAKIITNGELAPQETTITEIKQKIMKIPDTNGIVIDGFPRDIGQALSFEDQICTPDLVVFLACTNHHLKERLHKRAEQQGRPDDNPKAIDRRLTNFKQNTIPLVKYFQERELIVTVRAGDWYVIWYIYSRKPKVIFMMGGPGSGKSLQCERMEQRFGLRRVTLTELLCAELQSHSDRGHHLQDILERGEQLPEGTLLELLTGARFATDLTYLFPGWQVGEPSAVILLRCSADTMSRRLQTRRRSTFAVQSDSDGVLQRRAESFCTDSQALISHYESKSILHTIDAERSPDEVLTQICQVMETF
uniref:Adenylate kinase 5 n=1 Tax=Takifugu rubripes TaxID=31033 RepID=A0A674PCU8_TAKRU